MIKYEELLLGVSWCFRVLQANPEFTSSFLAQRQEATFRVEELKCQIAQLPILFPWPGIAERRQAYILASQLCNEAESLQLTLATLAQQRRELVEKSTDTIWKHSSWVELDVYSSGLMAELKVNLQL